MSPSTRSTRAGSRWPGSPHPTTCRESRLVRWSASYGGGVGSCGPSKTACADWPTTPAESPWSTSNDLGSGLRRALEDQSGYYLLGYVLPAGSLAHHNRFHRIKVEVKRRDVRVRARPGFYGGPRTTSRTELTSLFSPVEAATVGLRLTSILGRADNGTTVVRLLLHIDANSLSFAESDGWQTTTLDVVGRTLDTDGAVVAASGWRYDFRARVDEHAKTLAQGLLYRNQIVVKRPGSIASAWACEMCRPARSAPPASSSKCRILVVARLRSPGLLVSGEVTAAVRDFARGERLTYALEAYNVATTVARARRLADVGGASTAPRRPGGPVTARRQPDDASSRRRRDTGRVRSARVSGARGPTFWKLGQASPTSMDISGSSRSPRISRCVDV